MTLCVCGWVLQHCYNTEVVDSTSSSAHLHCTVKKKNRCKCEMVSYHEVQFCFVKKNYNCSFLCFLVLVPRSSELLIGWTNCIWEHQITDTGTQFLIPFFIVAHFFKCLYFDRRVKTDRKWVEDWEWDWRNDRRPVLWPVHGWDC